jgi:phosphomannomutase/phosphoglucomutase
MEFNEGEHYTFMDKLVTASDFPDGSINTIDGLRVDFTDGFGLIRPSNTTPILVLRFEADDEAALERIQSDFGRLVHSVDANQELPF